uniref:hypothetical protein n=1 Tax=Prevotella sp. TaxID=59823 RepID=UPI0040258600
MVLTLPRRGIYATTAWYLRYHGVVLMLPRRGTDALRAVTRMKPKRGVFFPYSKS